MGRSYGAVVGGGEKRELDDSDVVEGEMVDGGTFAKADGAGDGAATITAMKKAGDDVAPSIGDDNFPKSVSLNSAVAVSPLSVVENTPNRAADTMTGTKATINRTFLRLCRSASSKTDLDLDPVTSSELVGSSPVLLTDWVDPSPLTTTMSTISCSCSASNGERWNPSSELTESDRYSPPSNAILLGGRMVEGAK